MDIADGLIQYLMLVALLTFHEFGHAWTAMKCGDDTARLQGRVSLNPLVHIDLIGTVLLPFLMIFLPTGVSRFMIGWAKPVPVNPHNLRNKNLDYILVTMAGPAMNLVLAVALVGLARISLLFHSVEAASLFVDAATLSLLLCFFNLIPIPPLDGSHILRIAIGMSWEAYANFARFGFIIIIVVLQIPFVREALSFVVGVTLGLLGAVFGLS
ncbi:MAG TPA: site-2 protease family protein [Verrucomicrobiae bacterium]|nr:site-2 protease family protein [Verrucomicrobiae bacterium]